MIITPEYRHTPTLWDEEERVYTDATKAQRVLSKIKTIWGTEGVAVVLRAFLSEENAIENHLLQAIRLMIQYPEGNVLENYANEAIVHIQKAAKSVGREVHRVKEFVRFEQVGTLYFAKIVPQYDVLPLVIPHFRARFQTKSGYSLTPSEVMDSTMTSRRSFPLPLLTRILEKPPNSPMAMNSSGKPTSSISISQSVRTPVTNSEACLSDIGNTCLRQNNSKICPCDKLTN